MTEKKYSKLIDLYRQNRNIDYAILSVTTSDFTINNMRKEDCLKYLYNMQIILNEEIKRLEKEDF